MSSPSIPRSMPGTQKATPDALPAGVSPRSAAYKRIALALFLAGFSTFSLLYCVQPLLPAFAREFGLGAASSSLSLSLSTGMLAVSILCAGALSERTGRRGLMFASMTLAALLNVFAALSPNWNLLLVWRALEGFALGGVPAVAMAYLAEEIASDGLGFSMGLYVGGTAFGGMVGRIGMSVLEEHFSWRTAMLAIGVVDLVAAAAFVMLLPPSRRFVKRTDLTLRHHFRLWGAQLRHARLPFVFAIGFLVMGAFVTIYNYAGFRLTAAPFNLSSTACGLIFGAYLFGMVSSSSAGALADRLGRAPVLVSGLLVFAAGLALTLSHSLAAIVVGIVLVTIGFFIAHSVASGWVGHLAGSAKGHAASLYLLAYYLGSSVLGSVGGTFWQHGAWTSVAAYVAVLLVLGLLAARRLSRT
ncbi:MFS transporter [Burkholderia stabilis]|uniref:Inner membrane transport protein ynfM,bicyclomycin/multidrug efflux system,Argininosuccinate lyase,MFS transporter, aromatic acid:H symporter (AAHS) family,Major Facilitator Superfamily n=1 Tax=Burkholderia stabilis TaxID=95485 RepID=A0AAJ5T6I1_9BURK|nr:MFS transporter [Burkholderia stabilis]VBB14745.1 Inner membrane transport protein ynfM,bicyclomycin/multidrug efflux system,Argininosuccinate lyase,MFS transporter, aromatic acid:H symporter (AAHS) family,Major Facilitator Superfamily [Burkholderia stabilis]